MQKKLTAQGPKKRKSYTVTLPIDWVKKEKLDKIREVDLNIVGNKVIISPSREIQERIIINADNYKDSLRKVLPGLYRQGVNEVLIQLSDNSLLEKIQRLVNEMLIGYEIVEQQKGKILIKDITKESQEEFNSILRRIFLLILQFESVLSQSEIQTLQKNITRLYNYCLRILMKKGHAEFQRTPIYYLIIDQLEKITDEFIWILSLQKISKERKTQLNEVFRLFRTAYELFYKFEIAKYNVNQDKTFLLKNKIKLEKNIDIAGMHIHNLSRLLNSLYGNIFIISIGKNSG
ncbi:MAG: hypothetical protein KKF46_02710 [Nanoarchaeota archaeon]|nr:hypothetical protein [Nanoarchaeota archaeon]MBU1321243.1 hypothetical protein [Nanoarchaeota archaeon]MBU1596997.1 hypothetical protein [Nanoarchaeota archaeon]MBU2441576.1 hypothetical protein [Nanoarchaeota archaeon]